MHILVFSSNENSKQNALAQKHEGNSYFISYNEENDIYDLIVKAQYPHVYKRNGNQSVCCMLVNQAQYDFIEELNSSVEILAIDDNNPATDYQWIKPNSENKFLSVVGNNFFTGSGVEGEEDYIPPRKKLAVLT